MESEKSRGLIVDCCVLRVLGDEFDPEVFFRTSKLIAYTVFRKGELIPGPRKISPTGGFGCDVGTGSLAEQIEMACRFIDRHKEELIGISANRTVEEFFIDFAYECRLKDGSVIIQCDFLPAEFIRLAGCVGMGVCLSLSKAMEGDTD